MNSYWITFEDGSAGCCDGNSEIDAKNIAKHITGKPVAEAQSLPYPARLTIWAFEHPIYGAHPAFCHDPENCKGKHSCPKDRACDD